MELYLGTMIRQVDSSLLDEWEKLRNRIIVPTKQRKSVHPEPRWRIRTSRATQKAFTAAIRNRVFAFLRGLVTGEFESAVAQLNSSLDAEGQPWTAGRLQQALEAYLAGHEQLCLNPNARNARHTTWFRPRQAIVARAADVGGSGRTQRLGG